MKLEDLLKVWCNDKHWCVEVKTELLGYFDYVLVFDSYENELSDLISYEDYIVSVVIDGEKIIIDGRML